MYTYIPTYLPTFVYIHIEMNRYKKKPKVKNLKSLVGGIGEEKKEEKKGDTTAADAAAVEKKEEETCSSWAGGSNNNMTTTTTTMALSGEEGKEEGGEVIISYWKPTLSLHLLHQFDRFPGASSLPPQMLEQVSRWVG